MHETSPWGMIRASWLSLSFKWKVSRVVPSRNRTDEIRFGTKWSLLTSNRAKNLYKLQWCRQSQVEERHKLQKLATARYPFPSSLKLMQWERTKMTTLTNKSKTDYSTWVNLTNNGVKLDSEYSGSTQKWSCCKTTFELLKNNLEKIECNWRAKNRI